MSFRQPSDALSDVSPRTRRREHKGIEAQARRVQIALPISGDPRPYAGRDAGPWIGLIPAIVVTAITQATGTAPGTGAVQLYYLANPTDSSATADAQNSSVTVLNWYTGSGTIAVGKHVTVFVWSGAYWLATADC